MKQLHLKQQLLALYQHFGLDITSHDWLYQFSAALLILLLAWLSLRFSRWLLSGRISRLITRSSIKWDDQLHQHNFFNRCAHAIPAVLIYALSGLLLDQQDWLPAMLQKLATIYLLIAAVVAGSAVLNTAQDAYNASHLAERAPITGFIQVGKLLLVVIAVLLVIATIIGKSPLLLLSGLGAITAVLLLIFRDTILGFVAGIQIAANRMVNTGDWICMPQYDTDGEVLVVGLTTVKIQNWDKTISTVPTYALISEPVKNWRGMQESDGRRIKRAISLDINSVRFLDKPLLDKLLGLRFIKGYLLHKQQELAQYHQQQQIDNQDLLNHRRLTNLGTLRAYMEAYLRHHPQVNQQMTLMVRQLPPTEHGIRMELYCFCNDKEWVNYEGIQADIFDHLLAILPTFELRAYQRVSDRQAGTLTKEQGAAAND